MKKYNFSQISKFVMRLLRDIVIVLMAIRTFIFITWLFHQRPSEIYTDHPSINAQYDWTLILTGLGWFGFFVWFWIDQKNELCRTGDYSSVIRRIPVLWLFMKMEGNKPDVPPIAGAKKIAEDR